MIRIFSFSHSSTRMETPGIADLPAHLSDPDRMVWVDLEDPNDDEVGVLGGIFGFHVLAAEDCIQGNYLPRVALYDTFAFCVLHAIDLDVIDAGVQTLGVGVFIGERFLVTHHSRQVKGIFDARGKVAQNPGALLKSPDWLLHGIVDAMVDHYQVALDRFDTQLDEITSSIKVGAQVTEHAIDLRAEVLHVKRVAVLQEHVVGQMAQGHIPWIAEANCVYFRNVHDHMMRSVQEVSFCDERLKDALAVWAATSATLSARRTYWTAVMTTVFAPLLLIALLFDLDLTEQITNPLGTVVGLILLVLTAGGIVGLLKWKRWF